MKRNFALILSSLLIFAGVASATDFYGYYCTQDCSGHKAGYEWAKKKQIAERENCGGRSNSFIEGCYAWVEDMNEQYENGDVDTGTSPEE
ncbi:MAG: hypothetical protein COB14_07580 [Alphaproteobacteria bacterium]|nr:MAG: hypothetical protein COB14_07580 [Alphaproteobacteria bacterium]